jgi:allophanate hydrolase
MTTSTDRVKEAYASIRAGWREGVWIELFPEEVSLAVAAEIDRTVGRGELLPLAGLVGAVKDNIDMAGAPTTAGCPAYSYAPNADATSVARLREAGLVIIGKTNLDQFATGLVGTRSPYGAPACASDPTRISGGSSSGSAVAVAVGFVDVALGTDTAGSGRVPAAFNGIVGTKPTRGLVPNSGVVPACPTIDCVSVFARTVALATLALAVMTGPDEIDPLSRAWTADAPRALPPSPTIAIPDESALQYLEEDQRTEFTSAIGRLERIGATVCTVDVTDLLDAGARLYGGAFVAERYASVGKFVDAHPGDVDPVVGPLVAAASAFTAADLVVASMANAASRLRARSLFDQADALMLPTVGGHPTFDEVAADPIGVNTRLGHFTTFCNLLDLAAVSVPVPPTAGGPSTFGITFFATAFGDQVLADLAARYLDEPPPPVALSPGAPVVVVGAHLSGQPLNHQLTSRGARLLATTHTAAKYRLFALPTTPPKPGLVASGAGGAAIEVEVWELPPARYADFIAEVSPPLSIGQVELADGTLLPGFVLSAHVAPLGTFEITHLGGWRAHLAAVR